jgi:hypothetical protein
MTLKSTVEEILKGKKRSMSWLALEMDKSVDGLRLSLVRESIKYTDINKMSVILEVSPTIFFENGAKTYKEISATQKSSEAGSEYSDLKFYKGMVTMLKDQLNDKEKIITLLSKNK